MSKNVIIKRLSDNREVLLSYGTPVAAFIPTLGYVKSDARYSVTSNKHANQYARRADGSVREVPEVEFRQLIAEVK